MEFDELKNAYNLFQKKYSLPGFEDLNSNFDIGKIERDSGNLLREVRRVMVEKVSHYLKLMELMLNPSHASPIFLILLKEINSSDKQVLDKLFSAFIELELSSHKLEVEYLELNEVEFIKKIYGVWKDNKSELIKLLSIFERNWKNNSSKNNKSKGYFN